MNTLKIKTKINCNTCGTPLNRNKSIKITSKTKEEAIKEAAPKIKIWKDSLKNKNCRLCQSIINDLK